MKKYKNCFFSALLVLVIACIGFLSVILKNNSVYILYGDSVEQQYAFIMGFWQKIHDFDFSLYEWSNGLGANSFSYIFYNLFSPFNLIYLLFPKEAIHQLMLYVNLFKMMVLAFMCSLWLQKIYKKTEIVVAGSLMITFSGWVLFYYHYQFLDAFVFYPLILYYAECFLQDNKKRGLVASIAALTFVNYYFMYMFVPFLWLYTLFRYLIVNTKAQVKMILKDAMRFLVLSLLAMGTAGVVLLPCLNFIMSSPRLASEELSVFVGIKDLIKIVSSLFTPVFSRIEPSMIIYQNQLTYQGWGGGASLFVSVFALVLLPHVFFLPDQRKKNVLLVFAGIIGVFLICPYFYKLFQGSIDTRFFYMAVFLEVILCCEVLSVEGLLKTRTNFTITFGVFVVFALLSFVSYKYSLSSLSSLKVLFKVQSILFVLLFLGQMVLMKKGCRSWLIFLVIEAFISTSIFVEYNEPIKVKDFQYEKTVNQTVETIKSTDSGFYRVLFDNSEFGLANDAYIHQVPGVSFYSSIYGYEQESFLERIKSKWSLPNYDGKYRLYTLAGAKYWVTKENQPAVPLGYQKVENEDYYVNTNFVELGYAVKDTISAETVFSLPFVTQDRIMQEYLVLEESTNKNYELHDQFRTLVEWAMPEYVEVWLETPLSDAIIYVENFGIPVVDVTLYYAGEIVRTESYWQYHYIDIYLSENELVDKIIIQGQDVDGTGSAINVYVAENASLTEKQIYQKRAESSFENVKFENDRITADIHLMDDSYVLTQIPYDSGWKVVVDGNESKVMKANGGFVALYLYEGEHHITFEYHMPWISTGFVVSVVSILVLILWFLKEKNVLSSQSEF